LVILGQLMGAARTALTFHARVLLY